MRREHLRLIGVPSIPVKGFSFGRIRTLSTERKLCMALDMYADLRSNFKFPEVDDLEYFEKLRERDLIINKYNFIYNQLNNVRNRESMYGQQIGEYSVPPTYRVARLQEEERYEPLKQDK